MKLPIAMGPVKLDLKQECVVRGKQKAEEQNTVVVNTNICDFFFVCVSLSFLNISDSLNTKLISVGQEPH
jgi:hypothetical protein